ncbi:hypothetical protein HPULCUR_008683 [Helicostylum pulchrum]|uniref:Arrestin C-terminal-like domain-containing protein n=1 Tax=Helicostylum pulchrum TaxID=562976 RepID=A0ABP9Y8B2_9FUNG
MDQVKSWCLNTLQLPLHTNNRISPYNSKRISLSPSAQSNTSTVKRDISPLTANVFLCLLLLNQINCYFNSSQSILLSTAWLKKKGQHLNENNVIKIYMKSPHVVANGELAGTLVIDQTNLQQVELSLIGIEVVHDIHYPFLNSLIFNLDHHQIQSHLSQDKLVIPFVITLPPELGGSYTDKRYAIDLYVPILDSKLVWKSITIDFSLSRMVWMSGAPIYITICDMKLQLLRKQTILNNVSCDIVSHSSLSKMGWWQPLEPNSKDNVTMTIDAPLNQVTVRNQKLIDVSFSIQMLICSAERSDIVAEFPVILVHPIAMDPPPPSSIKEPDVSSLRPPLSKNIDLSASSLTSILSITQPIPVSPLPPTSQRVLQKMKKSISGWGTLLSRKISFTHIGASPRMISSYTNILPPSQHTLPQDQPEDIVSLAEQRSMMKFGHIKGPKRFGQQPGCLGDAGLDIRNCFNVATAAEVIQSYAAEKVEIGILSNSPVSFSETHFKLKDGNLYLQSK